MTAKRDYYDVLGIHKTDDAGEIKKAYRKLAKKYHPDTNAGNKEAEEKFKEVTEAYNVLSDTEKKKLYDQFGHAAFDESMGGTGAYGQGNGTYRRTWRRGGPNGSYQEFHFEGDNMDDILKNIFGGSGFHGTDFSGSGFGGSGFHDTDFGGAGFGSGYQDAFRSGGSRKRGYSRGNFAQDGADRTADLFVTFDEAAFGGDKMIHLDGKTLKVHIPAGIDTGKSIRLRGKGMPGINGGKAGDLMLKVQVGEKPGFGRKGMDVYTTVKIPFTTAVLGGEVPVQTMTGKVLCKIKEGTQSGTKIRLRGKGIVSMRDQSVHGDQFVTVQILVPENLSKEAKKKLREFEQICAMKQSGAA